MASENDPTTTDAETPAVDTPQQPEAPAPKRRRASKKAAAPEPLRVTGEESAAVAAPAPEGEEPADAAPAPKKATRKRAAKKTSTKKAGAPADEAVASSEAATSTPEDAAADQTGPDTSLVGSADAAEAAAGTADVEAAEQAEDADETVETAETDETAETEGETEEAEGEAAPAVPSFGLLFQAPEPVVRPRRRATAPAQAPAERLADEVAATPEPPADEDEDVPEAAAEERTDDRAEDRADDAEGGSRQRRRRGGRGRRGRDKGEEAVRGDEPSSDDVSDEAPTTGPDQDEAGESGSSRRRRRRRRGGSDVEGEDPPGTVTKVREPRAQRDEPTAVKGSTRLEAKKQRRREGREAGRRRTIITEAEFLARRESVERVMVVRGRGDRTQIGVLEDGVLVEHYVSRETTASMAGNVYLGRVQNVLPSMEAAFVDIGKGRNAVLYAGEVNWDAAGLEGGQARRIENALSSGDTVLVQVTKDPIGHKGARLTSQISLPGRYLVYVPEGSMTGISRKLPDTERARLKAILKEVVPDTAGVIVRTAAEGASEEELRADVERLTKAWEKISKKAETAKARKAGSGGAPVLLHGEPDLTVRVIRDVFTEDFTSLVISGDKAWAEVSEYVEDVAPDLAPRLTRWTSEDDVFAAHRIDEALAKAMDRKVWLPSGGSLVIDRTEAMTVVDVNTGKFVGSGGNLEETVTKNNLEAAEEIVRQLRLRDIGGIIVIDFIDMVLESNRDLVVRRLLECLGRDRTKHQVAEVTSLGLVQMTRKRVGSGLIEVFSEPCEHCGGRGIVVHSEPIDRGGVSPSDSGSSRSGRGRGGRGGSGGSTGGGQAAEKSEEHRPSGPSAAQIAAAAHAAALRKLEGEHHEHEHQHDDPVGEVATEVAADEAVVADVPAEDAAAAIDVPAQDAAPAIDVPAEDEGRVAVTEAVEPATGRRGRRRRGRVVAPAGPPRTGAGSSSADGGPEPAPEAAAD